MIPLEDAAKMKGVTLPQAGRPTMDEREELARLIDPLAFEFAGALGSDQPRAYRTADRILAAGYHNGPRLPQPGTPEEAAMVERMAAAYWLAVYGRHRHSTQQRWPNDVLGGSQELFRVGCLAALRAAFQREPSDAR